MNKEQQELIDIAYQEYRQSFKDYWSGKHYDIPTITTFIDRMKNQEGFFKNRGLKIEERELSLEERTEYKKKRDGISRTFAPYTHQMLDGSNIPTKLITITYKDKIIENYENNI